MAPVLHGHAAPSSGDRLPLLGYARGSGVLGVPVMPCVESIEMAVARALPFLNTVFHWLEDGSTLLVVSQWCSMLSIGSILETGKK